MKKSSRLNNELIFLTDKESFQIKDLMAEFGISKRTALRDIEELEGMGLAIYAEYGRNGGYRLLKQKLLTPIHFTYEEITAIFYALKALSQLSINPFGHTYPSVSQKLLASISPSQQADVNKILDVIHYYNVFPINEPAYLSKVLESIVQNQVLDIVYTQYERVQRSLQFFDMFYREGIWFTHALDRQRDEWGIYRCDYIEECELNLQLDGHNRDEMSLSLKKHLAIFHSIPFRCKLTKFGRELFLKNNYEEMRLVEEDGNSFLVGHYNPSEIGYLTHYLLEFGEHIRIESPKELKESYLASIQRICEKYEENE